MTRKRFKVNFISMISIVAVLISIFSIYYIKKAEAIREHNRTVMNEASNLLYTKEDRAKGVEMLTTLFKDGKYLSMHEKAHISIKISHMYFVDSNYDKGLEYSITALYLADRLGDNFIEARALIDMSNVFVSLEVFEKAESTLKYVLSLEIKDNEQARQIKKYAYINLADIYSKTDRWNQALAYISHSMKYYDISDQYYKEEMLIRKIITARALFYKGEVEKSKTIITAIADDVEIYGRVFPINISIPYLGVKSKIKIQEGDTQEGIRIAEELFDLCDKESLVKLKKVYIEYILDVLHTYHYTENIDIIKSYEYYLLKLQNDLIDEKNQGFVTFIIHTYKNKINYFNALSDRVDIFLRASYIIIAITIMIVTLLFRLKQTKRQRDLDALTGVHNRGKFDKEYKKYLIKESNIGLIIVDIDHFKKINDTYGHSFGDVVLKNIAKIIKNRLSKDEKIYRYGGEEFCIICKNQQMDEVITLAQQLRDEVENMVWREGIKVTISLGVAYTNHAEDIFKVADEKLYESKKTGRNKVSY